MTYYKVIKDNEFVGIGTSYELRKYQLKHGILLVADDNTAQYIQINDKLYRDNWFKVLTTNTIEYETASISVIDESEYQQLFEAIDAGEEISNVTNDEDTYYQEDDNVVDSDSIITLDYLKTQKIKEMSYYCNQAIVNGFDVELSDGRTHHFSLTVQDQLNLITLSSLAASGVDNIPYHADGELCEFFSVNDIQMIVKAATELKTYHTTYYNSLKLFIQSLVDRDDVANVIYGANIPDEYKSDVLIALLSNKQ
jgi:hypothetical protein